MVTTLSWNETATNGDTEDVFAGTSIPGTPIPAVCRVEVPVEIVNQNIGLSDGTTAS